ncbi:MAG: PEP-CTERM sorting domain-containing protein [Oscillatoriaceae bacterium SKW80]|nr:PEP-CTERM sorting domain-containing protein [Oscillatoriaceae bacterium SKYG93]MCX8122165.1 PEP-CTERM sorting domain-containing protein [Oscillatoriaceae bacterium SKW80]MDW8454452.1 PEP-CTERM sorting domain-containing protein [Oscillatoriaceae cyanobacterium SKYGB_i_bin93]HIK29316.1 PEP-CTERM sorting domain-containing protein [Oscillatoriaceae cyanobacterium M7585_C2015_266]
MKKQLIAGLSVATIASILSVSTPARAFVLSFGTDGIKFDRDTTVKFTFVKSQGKAKSTLGIFDATGTQLLKTLFEEEAPADPEHQTSEGPNAWLGTTANLKGRSTVDFTFAANTVYTLGLFGTLDGATMPTMFSTSSLNYGNSQQAVFDSAGGAELVSYSGIASSYQSGKDKLAAYKPVLISFEDLLGGYWGENGGDFNDFTITAEAVPEPLTIGGLALGGAWLAYNRRRRQSQAN